MAVAEGEERCAPVREPWAQRLHDLKEQWPRNPKHAPELLIGHPDVEVVVPRCLTGSWRLHSLKQKDQREDSSEKSGMPRG